VNPLPGLITLDLNVDVEKLLSKTWDKVLAVFGRSASSEELRKWLDERTRVAFRQSRDVQCVGMHEPVLISDIYQPTRLLREQPKTVRIPMGKGREWDARAPEVIPVSRILAHRENSIITAGPGWGKTTFLHWVYLQVLLRENTGVLPFLVTLRQKSALGDLCRVVENLGGIQVEPHKGRILLLVDGYDEIPTESRKQVSELLLKFAARNVGEYYLTCREYYEIYELKAPKLKIAEFDEEDQVRFATAFLRAYGSALDGKQVIHELYERGFSDLVRHPLLLTLAALVTSSSSDIRARNVVSLIDGALSTLSLRWDQGKGLRRETTTPLDGIARTKLLKRLAYTFDLEPVSEHRAVGVVRKNLELMSCEGIEPLEVLLEMARFYGIFVPIAGEWGFVHRSLQDFLAAQYWVETGAFAAVLGEGKLKFDSRTAFAGCLVEDGTRVMELALAERAGLPVFVEMLVNDASFKHDRIASAIRRFYETYGGEHYYHRTDEKVECALTQEFVTGASSKFLDYVVQACGSARGRTSDTLAAYAIIELLRRRVPLSKAAYDACRKNYGSEKFVIDVRDRGHVRFADLPHH
jgi:hypothetical protein